MNLTHKLYKLRVNHTFRFNHNNLELYNNLNIIRANDYDKTKNYIESIYVEVGEVEALEVDYESYIYNANLYKRNSDVTHRSVSNYYLSWFIYDKTNNYFKQIVLNNLYDLQEINYKDKQFGHTYSIGYLNNLNFISYDEFLDKSIIYLINSLN